MKNSELFERWENMKRMRRMFLVLQQLPIASRKGRIKELLEGIFLKEKKAKSTG